MTPDPYQPAAYWQERLSHRLDILGTGHQAFGLGYNRWLYQAQFDCLDELLERHAVSLQGCRGLDVGCGVGAFIQYFAGRGAGSLTGVDITPASVERMRQHYPEFTFIQGDISAPDFVLDGAFDLVYALNVLYHIVDGAGFRVALSNLCRLTGEGGYLVLSDTFQRPPGATAVHVRFRDLSDYSACLEHAGFEILEIRPIYYLLNRTFLPRLGPRLIDLFRLGRLFYRIDRYLRQWGWDNRGEIKVLLAHKR